MTKVHIIGKGYFGKKIESSIKDMVEFVKPEDADWIIISTPNDLHFEQVQYWLGQRKNVFCEKPLCLSESAANELYALADFMNVKLYVDDVFRHHKYHKESDIFYVESYNSFKWHKWGSFRANIIDNLAYHHFYMSDFCYSDFEVEDIKVKKHWYAHQGLAKFDVVINGERCKYDYKIDEYDYPFIHTFNDYEIKPVNNPLKDMFTKIFDNTAQWETNKKITLNAIKISEVVKKELFEEVLVVGGGIFGTTAATTLSCAGFNVTLAEEKNDLITAASYINQYRLHKGYHYPRSRTTAEECIVGLKSFKRKYESTVINGGIEHYYAIAINDSMTTPHDYIDFLQDLNLDFQIVQPIKGTALTVKVNEELFDMIVLRNSVKDKLRGARVNVELNTRVTKKRTYDYDYVVNATYANINQLKGIKQEYQFELCEKPVVLLPEQYRNKSIVVMDGPFMCLDPFKDTSFHVLGHVEHAIHSRNVGTKPIIPKEFKEYINAGVVSFPEVTNIELFKKAGMEFFDDFDKLEHVGSMYTIRTVLTNREHDDARPTLVEQGEGNMYNVFSGKIDTCVEASNQLIKKMKGKRYV